MVPSISPYIIAPGYLMAKRVVGADPCVCPEMHPSTHIGRRVTTGGYPYIYVVNQRDIHTSVRLRAKGVCSVPISNHKYLHIHTIPKPIRRCPFTRVADSTVPGFSPPQNGVVETFGQITCTARTPTRWGNGGDLRSNLVLGLETGTIGLIGFGHRRHDWKGGNPHPSVRATEARTDTLP